MSRRAWIISTSLAVHGGLALALVAHGVWDIDQLDPGRAEVSLAVPMAVPPPPAAAAAPSHAQLPVSRPKHVVKTLAQPIKIARIEPQRAQGASGTNPLGTGTGTDTDGTGTCTVEPCGPIGAPIPTIEIPKIPEVPEVEIPKTKILPPDVFEKQRISGNTQIGAPNEVRLQMRRDDVSRTVGIVYVCVAADGAISSVTLTRSTKYPAYDARLVEGVRTWKYKPLMIGGKGVPSCGYVNFVYSMQ
ncbi:MAG: energy transducer TonB [Deltaproteobacteria bacterium]|nr:energy transducer TonB [Deltaproteobacteria bacterium]